MRSTLRIRPNKTWEWLPTYLYSAPQPFTKLMRIVHMRVNWYTASKPWFTVCASIDANSWLLNIFRLHPVSSSTTTNMFNSSYSHTGFIEEIDHSMPLLAVWLAHKKAASGPPLPFMWPTRPTTQSQPSGLTKRCPSLESGPHAVRTPNDSVLYR